MSRCRVFTAYSLLASWALATSPSFGHAVEVEFERNSDLPLVNINVAVKTGAVSDPSGQSGITNLMGEMLLRGTQSRTKEQIDVELDQMGARLEVETRAESMIIRGSVLSSQLDRYLRLVLDVVTRPSFPELELNKLKKEISSGILEELGRDPSLNSRKFSEFLFQQHPYGNPILGRLKDIEKVTMAQVKAHYDKLMRDRLFLVVGAGDATEGQIQSWADQLASARPGGEEPVGVKEPKSPAKRRLLIVDKPGRSQVQISAGQLGVKLTDPNYFPLYVGNYSFGGGSFSSRLMVEIRVKRGWSYGAGSVFRHGRQPRSWHFAFAPKSANAAEALAEGIRLVEGLKKNGLTEAEFKFAKDSLVASAGFSYNTPEKRVENILLERTLKLPDGFIESYASQISRVSLADVNRSLSQFLKPEELSITVLATASELKDALAKAAGVPASEVQVMPYTQD